MAQPDDRQYLAAIRARHEQASFDWSLGRDGETLFARLVPGTQPAAIVTMTVDCGDDDRDFLLGAHADIAFLLQLLGRAFHEIRSHQSRHDHPRERQHGKDHDDGPKDYAAECAMKCADQLFRRYLMEKHDLPDAGDDLRVATRVRSILAIQSRAELNTNPEAAARWKALRADFDFWRNSP